MGYSNDEVRPIAVIGLSGRFPGQATNPDKLWQMCAAGEDAWSPFPSNRFNSEAFYHPDGGRNGSVSRIGPVNAGRLLTDQEQYSRRLLLERRLGSFRWTFLRPQCRRSSCESFQYLYFKSNIVINFNSQALDPQQRLLLECSYEAFEDGGSNLIDAKSALPLTTTAGIRIEDIAGESVGVFIGTFGKDWWNVTSEDADAIPM
jgi:acyl transferase domain-containing protein